jgi:hypothetical protein
VDKVAHAGSDAAACVRVPDFAVHVSEQQLKVATSMLGSMLACTRMQPSQHNLPPVTSMMHVAVKGVFSGSVVIDGPEGAQEIDVGRAAVVLGAGLGGVAGAMVTHLVLTGVRIIHRSVVGSEPASLMLHVPPHSRTKVCACPPLRPCLHAIGPLCMHAPFRLWISALSLCAGTPRLGSTRALNTLTSNVPHGVELLSGQRVL